MEEPKIADAEEVLRLMTDILRGTLPDGETASVAERRHAADFLGRHYGLLDTDSGPDPDRARAIAEVERLFRGLRRIPAESAGGKEGRHGSAPA